MSKLTVTIIVCFVILLVGGCETPSGGDPDVGWSTSDSPHFTPGGPSGISVNPKVPSRRNSSGRTGTVATPLLVVSKAPKPPTLKNLIPCYLTVAEASFVQPEKHDQSSGILLDNFREGYGLWMNEVTILSPARLEGGKRGFIVYTLSEAREYKFPEQSTSTDEVYFIYDMKVRMPDGKTPPVTIYIRKVGEVQVDFDTDESYETALKRQKKDLDRQRIGYRIYLKSEEVSADYPVISGERVDGSKAVSSMICEMKMLLEDIVLYSGQAGISFRGATNPNTDKELAKKKLEAIEQVITACRLIDDDNLQRTVDRVQEVLEYSNTWKNDWQ